MLLSLTNENYDLLKQDFALLINEEPEKKEDMNNPEVGIWFFL